MSRSLEREPLLQGLFEALPSPVEMWPTAERARWLRAAVAIFDLVYTAHSDEEVSIIVTGKDNDEPG